MSDLAGAGSLFTSKKGGNALLLFVNQLVMWIFARILAQRTTLVWVDGVYLFWCLTVSWFFSGYVHISMILTVLFMMLMLVLLKLELFLALMVTIKSFFLVLIIERVSWALMLIINRSELIPLVELVLDVLVGVGLAWLIRKQSKQTSITKSDYFEQVGLLLLFIIGYTYVQLLGTSVMNNRMATFDLAFFGLLVFAIGLIEYGQRRLIKRRLQLRHEQDLLVSNQRYTKEVEKHYEELRRFRHEYQNVLLSLNEYIVTDDFTGLKHYYSQTLKLTGKRVTQEKYALEDLSRVQDKPLKSILFNKLITAQNNGVKVRFECHKKITFLNVNKFQLLLSLGILLDNAVEATSGHHDSEIHVVLINGDRNQMIVVKNTIMKPLPPLWQLEQVGYSSKGDDRGLGLANLHTMVDANPQMSLETTVTDTSFLQKIVINKGDLND